MEYGGLAIWYHIDLMLPGNIIDASKNLVRQAHQALGGFKDKLPGDILTISDRCDGTYLCLRKSGSNYLPTIWIWDSEELIFEMFAANLEEALTNICDCSEEDLGGLIKAESL